MLVDWRSISNKKSNYVQTGQYALGKEVACRTHRWPFTPTHMPRRGSCSPAPRAPSQYRYYGQTHDLSDARISLVSHRNVSQRLQIGVEATASIAKVSEYKASHVERNLFAYHDVSTTIYNAIIGPRSAVWTMMRSNRNLFATTALPQNIMSLDSKATNPLCPFRWLHLTRLPI